MAIKDEPRKTEVTDFDPLAEKIRDSILGVETLRAENRRLTEHINAIETTKLQLETSLPLPFRVRPEGNV